ncbi:hypothetical protein [Kocuria sp.]|uniref:hypothetical protein n=1 Tax=Kocuria sp. TaxID=1871328 RepID=UPI0026DDB24F|nr:hypothetical protein [Kocuria sp.]MDO4918547.1 hypothetical protein [Kocuria sp.]
MTTATHGTAQDTARGVLTPREHWSRSDRQLALITLLLRLPQIMTPLGVLTWVAVSTSSAWTAALSGASLCFGMAVCGAGMALFSNVRWRLGGLAGTCLIQGVVMWQLSGADVGDLAATGDTVSAVVPFFVAGLSLAPMGLAARLRWASVVHGEHRPGDFGSAMRRESVNEALATVLAAALTGLLAVLTGPDSVLRVSAALSLVTMALFVAHPSARHPQANMPATRWWRRQGITHSEQLAALRLRHELVYGIAALNALLGAAQGCLTVNSVSLESVESMGVMYALLGFGAAVGSSLAVRFRHRITAANMWVLMATGALLTSMLFSGPSGALGFAAVLMAVGFFSGPCLTCIHSSAGLVDVAHGYIGIVALMNVASSAAMGVGLLACAYLGMHYDYMSAAMIPVVAAMVLLGTALLFSHGLRRRSGYEPGI